MASLEITNDNKIKVNVNSSDSWSLNLNNSNFMLKKYNGIGTSIVELKTFSNVGELFGEIELFVNGKLCNNYDLKQINGSESDFFYIIPNVINLNGKGDVKNVIVYTNDSQWEYETLNNNNRIIVSKENNNLIITSNINEIFYDLRIKIYSNNLDGKPYDYVTVNQIFKSYISEEEGDLFKVNPTYLLFTKPNEVKNVTVTTSCKDGYEISTVTTPFSLTDNGKGKLSVKYIGDGNTSASTSFNVTSCGSSKKVDIKYDNSFNTQNYLYIISSDTKYSEVTTSLVKNGENDSLGILEYELSSTSKVMVYSKPNQIVTSISNLDGNNSCKLRVQFDNNEDFQGQIKLRNNDGIFAYINISVSGYGDAKGIVFKFSDTNENTKVIESNENGEYVVNIKSFYNKDKKPLNFNIHTSDFTLKEGNNIKPYKPSTTSTTLTFKPNSNVKGNKTIQLEEVETFKRLYIKINIDYGNAYYEFYFVDNNGNESYSWYLTYDYQGKLLNDNYASIKSLSGNSINNVTSETSFSPSSYSEEELGIVSELVNTENYSSSFTFTQNGSNNTIKLYVTQISEEKEIEPPTVDTHIIEHGGDGSVSYSKSFCLNERTLGGYIICSTNGSYIRPYLDSVIGIDESNITIDLGTPSGTEVPFYMIFKTEPNQSTVTPTFCHPNAGCIFFTINATVDDCVQEKIKITVIFSGIYETLETNKFDGDYGCDDKYSDNPGKIVLESNIDYMIECSDDNALQYILIEGYSQSYHQGKEHSGITSFTPTTWTGTIPNPKKGSLIDVVSDSICYNIEQSAVLTGWNATLIDDSKYELEIISNVNKEEDICNNVSIKCNPTSAVTSGNAVSTEVTLNGDNIWKVETEKGIGSGETGGSFRTSVVGKHKIYSNKCPDKYCIFEIIDNSTPIEPSDSCVNATVKFSTSNSWGDSDANSQVTHKLCPNDASVNAGCNFYYGFGSEGHNHTFSFDFSIEGVAAIIKTIESDCDSGNHSGDGSFGFTYSEINPDLLFQNGNQMTVSGTYTFIDATAVERTSDYTIIIEIIEN